MRDAPQHRYIRGGYLHRLVDDFALASSVLRFAAVEAGHKCLQLYKGGKK